jgi:hypothetical protein
MRGMREIGMARKRGMATAIAAGDRRSGFGVRSSEFGGRSQDIGNTFAAGHGNTVTVLVSAIWQRGSIGFFVCGSLFF